VGVIHVADLSDPRLADYRNVPDPQLLRERGVFVAEGRHVVRRLLAEPRFTTRSVLLTPTALDAMADAIDRAPDIPVFVVRQDAIDTITGFDIHRGCLAIGERPSPRPWAELVRNARMVLVLERVGNADNVGGIFRNAAALGANAVLLGPACADPLYRKAIRTSMGAALRVPFAEMEDWPVDLSRLQASGFRLLALTPADSARPIEAASPGDRVALLLGHEGDGLSDDALRHADVRVRIPMAEGVDSLNVATAAAIALHDLRLR
jgi:tRNA G18 (ribose-2'-O)-methylase SpoU